MTYLLLFLSSFLAATFIPFSSEIHFAYVVNNEGLWLAVFIATLGNTLGGMLTYYLGWIAKWNWIEKYFRVKHEKVESLKESIQKYGSWMGALCWLPLIGDVIAVGLGVFRVNPKLVFLMMILGKSLRYLIFGLIIS